MVTAGALVMQIYSVAASYGFMLRGSTGTSLMEVQGSDGKTVISNLAGGTATLVSTSTAGLLGRVTLGTGLSLVSGTLSVTAGTYAPDFTLTAGSVVYSGGTDVLSQDNTRFFWNTTTHALQLGTNNTTAPTIDVNLRMGTGANYYDIGRDTATGPLFFYGTQSGFTGYRFGGVNGTRLDISTTGLVYVPGGTPNIGFKVGTSTETSIQTEAGNSTASYANVHFALAYANSGQYRHTIRTRHQSAGGVGNSIDFFTWGSADGASGLGSTRTLSLDGGQTDVLSLAAGGIVAATVTSGRLGLVTVGTGLSFSAGTLSCTVTGGITQLTGDVTAGPGSGSVAATIASHAVTAAKFRQSVALSVVGNSGASTADVIDLSTTSGTAFPLRESGGSLGFGTLATAALGNNIVTYAKMQQASAASMLLGRGGAGGSGNYQEISIDTTLAMTGAVLGVVKLQQFTLTWGGYLAGIGTTLAGGASLYLGIGDNSWSSTNTQFGLTNPNPSTFQKWAAYVVNTTLTGTGYLQIDMLVNGSLAANITSFALSTVSTTYAQTTSTISLGSAVTIRLSAAGGTITGGTATIYVVGYFS
jgi:hypothetical protein